MTHTVVCIGEISKFETSKSRGRTGWAGCRCVYVFEGLVHVCVFWGRKGVWWGWVVIGEDNDHDSHPTDPPAVLLSSCLRFGFGTYFEPATI